MLTKKYGELNVALVACDVCGITSHERKIDAILKAPSPHFEIIQHYGKFQRNMCIECAEDFAKNGIR